MMKLVFFEAPLFSRLLVDYLTDDAYRELQKTLMDNPELGGRVLEALENCAGKIHGVVKAREEVVFG